MKRKIIPLMAGFLLLLPQIALSLSSRDVIRLTEAGVSQETITLLVQEQTIRTGVFSVADLVEMKNAGVSDETLQILIYSRSQMRGREPIRYGEETRTLKFLTVEDILRLKEGGVNDEVIRTAIIHSQKSKFSDQRSEALDMLREMGVIVDLRE